MYQYKRPPKPTKPKIPKMLYLVLAVILLISAGVIANYVYQDFRYAHGIGNVLASETPVVDETPTPQPQPDPTPAPTPEPMAVHHPEATPEPTPEPTPTPTPIPRVPRQEFLDWQAYYNNPNIIAHVYIPNTTINYLVAQGTDNSFYLYHDLRGRRYAPGSIFLDYLADLYNPGDDNWVLFGHNMGRNHKFHMVRNWLNQDFFFNNRYIYFNTIYASYVFEIFSVYVTHIDWPYINVRYYEHWDYKINRFAEMSRFDAGIEVSSEDRILTLSTCENSYRHNRIAMHARLISETFPHLEDGDSYDHEYQQDYEDIDAAG